MRRIWVALAAAGLAGVAACGGGSGGSSSASPEPAAEPPPPAPSPPPPDDSPPPDPPPPSVEPPVTIGAFAFYGEGQGLSPTVYDVSADEGGNVYVAAGDAVFVKARDAQDFQRVSPEDAGLTANCHPPDQIANPDPPDPPVTCPIISVSGAAPGKAVLGFQGVGIDFDYDAPWALDSGGADLVSWDGAALHRDRHVLLASPPGVICEHWRPGTNNTVCDEWWIDSPWRSGRKKMRQVKRIVVNHDRRHSISYGDVLLGATHGSLGILVAHPETRGWLNYTKGDVAWEETRGVWEHEHPANSWSDGRFLTGESTGLALDPIDGVPWFSNQYRTASLPGYASMRRPSWNGWWGEMSPARPFLAFWEPEGHPDDAARRDGVSGLSFCDDGTLWVASANHGIGRLRRDGSFLAVDLPAGTGNSASAIACDPSDRSVWVGFGWGGFGRWNGAWDSAFFVPRDAPGFAWNPVRSIQIDRWTPPRAVYLAHEQSAKFGPGGVTAYTGP